MKRLVVGTAGHIDHGKTSLVKALTGIDTDRLKEEKARGITIELGFAHLDLPGGQRLAFVDVPGHERFVRTMIAGATGIDAVLLVIAADEGVMPQTREHLDILRLLGVRHGAVVLSRVDLVDEELLELALEDVSSFVKGTFLEGAPIVAFSAVTGVGRDQLISLLRGLAEEVSARSSDGIFRLPVDRVFSLRGFGTVVTGTLTSGKLSTGEQVEILPSGLKAKVRGLQVHGQEVTAAYAGQRTAVNLQGLEKDRIDRGHQLVAPGRLLATGSLDVYYQHLPGSPPLKHRDRVRFLSGTVEVNGQAHVLSGESLEAGESGYLQLRLDESVPARAGDRFILRLETPVVTLGGGQILDPWPQRHRRRGRLEAAVRLDRLRLGGLADEISVWLELFGPEGVSLDRLARRSMHEAERLKEGLQQAVADGRAVALDAEGKEYVAQSLFEGCQEALLERLRAFHLASPLKRGMARGELRNSVAFFGERVLLKALEGLVQAGSVQSEGGQYFLPRGELTLDAGLQALADGLLERLTAAGTAPPLVPELKEALGEEEDRLVDVLNYLTHLGKARKVKEGMWMATSALEGLQETLVAFFRTEPELTPVAFKELTGLSRKWAIPLLEYLDKTQFTLRVGDVRRLRTAVRAGQE